MNENMIIWIKLKVQFLRLSTLIFPIEFKLMVALTNEIQKMLSFLRIFKFNLVMCLNSIREPNVPNLIKCT